jgi:hypothetical protein
MRCLTQTKRKSTICGARAKRPRTQPPQTINITHNYPPAPAPSPGTLEAIAVIAAAAKANAEALQANALSIQKIADMAGESSTQSIVVEASAFTAKTGATMHIGAPTTISTTTKLAD